MDYSVVAAIIIMIALLGMAFSVEYQDLNCGENGSGPCYEGNLRYIAKGKASPDDTVDKSLTKLDYLSNFPETEVKWRRCIIVSAFVCICLIILIPELRTIQYMFIVFISMFVGTYAMYNWYEYHVYPFVSGYAKENISQIRRIAQIPTSVPVYRSAQQTIDYIKLSDVYKQDPRLANFVLSRR